MKRKVVGITQKEGDGEELGRKEGRSVSGWEWEERGRVGMWQRRKVGIMKEEEWL